MYKIVTGIVQLLENVRHSDKTSHKLKMLSSCDWFCNDVSHHGFSVLRSLFVIVKNIYIQFVLYKYKNTVTKHFIKIL